MIARVGQVIELYVELETYAKRRIVTMHSSCNLLKLVPSKADQRSEPVTPELRVDAS